MSPQTRTSYKLIFALVLILGIMFLSIFIIRRRRPQPVSTLTSSPDPTYAQPNWPSQVPVTSVEPTVIPNPTPRPAVEGAVLDLAAENLRFYLPDVFLSEADYVTQINSLVGTHLAYTQPTVSGTYNYYYYAPFGTGDPTLADNINFTLSVYTGRSLAEELAKDENRELLSANINNQLWYTGPVTGTFGESYRYITDNDDRLYVITLSLITDDAGYGQQTKNLLDHYLYFAYVNTW